MCFESRCSDAGVSDEAASFDDSGKAFLGFTEFCGFYPLSIEAVEIGVLVFVEFFGSERTSQQRNRIQHKSGGNLAGKSLLRNRPMRLVTNRL